MLSISLILVNILQYISIPFFLLLAFKQKWAWLLWAVLGLINFILADFSMHWSILFQIGLGIYGFYFWHTTEKLAPAYIPEKVDESLLDTMYTVPEAPLNASGFSLPTQSKDFQLILIVIGLYILLSLVGIGDFQFNLLNLDNIYPLLDIVGMGLLAQKRRLGFIFLIAYIAIFVLSRLYYNDNIFTWNVVMVISLYALGYQKWSKA
jgi:hypothetical protein